MLTSNITIFPVQEGHFHFTRGLIWLLASVDQGLVGSLAVALFVVFVLQQRRTSHKLVPSDLARDRLIILGNIATALTGACFQVGLWYFLTYRMQTQFGYSPIQAGLAFLPLTASTLIVNLWLTPRLMKRLAPRGLIVAGVVIAVPGLIWLTIVERGSFAVAILIPTVAIGIGGGLMNTPLATLVTTGVRPEHAGAASGLMNTAKQFGGAIGLAAATAAAAIAGTDRVAFAFMSVTLLVVIAAAAAIPAHRSKPQTEKRQGERRDSRKRTIEYRRPPSAG